MISPRRASGRDLGVLGVLGRVAVVWAMYATQAAALRLLSTSDAAYEGWLWFENPSFGTVRISLCVLAVLAAALSLVRVSVRHLTLWWLMAAMVVPSWVIHDHMTLFPEEVTQRTALAVSAGFLTMTLVSAALPTPTFRLPALAPRTFARVLAVLLTASLVVAVVSLGVPSPTGLSLGTVYERRAEFKDVAGGSVVAYLVIWLGQVLAPLALITGLRFRRWGLVFLGFAAAGYVYAVVGAKSAPMILALAGLLYWLTSVQRRLRLGISWPLTVLSASLAPLVIFCVTGWFMPLYLLTRRFSLLTAVDAAGHALLAQSTGSRIASIKDLAMAVSGQLSDGVSRGSIAVGALIRPGTGNNANSHFLSYSLQWESFVPTLMVAFLGAVILWLFDLLGSDKDRRMSLAFGGTVCFSLSEFYLHTAMVTGGLLLALALAALLPSESKGMSPGAKDHRSSSHKCDARSYVRRHSRPRVETQCNEAGTLNGSQDHRSEVADGASVALDDSSPEVRASTPSPREALVADI